MMGIPGFYQQERAEIVKRADELRAAEQKLAEVYARWEELESREG